MTAEKRERFRAALRAELEAIQARAGVAASSGGYSAGGPRKEVPLGKRRRQGPPHSAAVRGLTLVSDEDGVLSWEEGYLLPAAESTLRRRRTGRRTEVVDQLQVEPLEPSRVSQRLEEADRDLTPNQGLLEWRQGQLAALPAEETITQGRVLLFLHGAFSHAQPIFDQLLGHGAGRAFLNDAAACYDRILAFNHPTLAVSPVLNALDLAQRFTGAPHVDVISHSRGGLVARWWLEAFDRPPAGARRRAILVGSPLGGTSLASPPHLRRLLSWGSNLAAYLDCGASTGSLLIPWVKVVAWLAQLTGVVTNLIAATPLVDAAIALVPGLAAMSRTLNNPELTRLRMRRTPAPEYRVIRASYRPDPVGWKFWRAFVGPRERALHALFPAANDTVVDFDAMADLPEPVPALEFPEGPVVHHTNYFLQPETANWLREQLLESDGAAIWKPRSSRGRAKSPRARRDGRAHS